MAEVEVDKVPGLVRDVRPEVPPNDAVPSGIVLFVELLLDVAGDVFLDVVLLQRLSRAVHGILAGGENARGRDKKCTCMQYSLHSYML